MRIGQGFDVHAFGEGDSVVLGGIRIAHSHGLKAHSDGDVLAHALCDALIGGAGLGDIGQHFPDSDPAFAGVDSMELLSQVQRMLRERGLVLVNADTTVVAAAPRLAPYVPDMRERLAAVLEVDRSQVNVKATTTEGLGFTGRGEGIAAFASVLLDERHAAEPANPEAPGDGY